MLTWCITGFSEDFWVEPTCKQKSALTVPMSDDINHLALFGVICLD